MSGFTDSIVGGVGSLIRQYIKSPNYAKGVSGWSINQDGSAEFNDATFRGTVVIDAAGTSLLIYDGAPAAGNLILSLSAFAGTDVYGNNYPGGICTTNANGTASNAGYTSRWNPTDPLSGVQPLSLAFINNLQCGLISQLELFVQSTTNDLVLQAGPGNFLRALADNIFIGQAGAALSKMQFGAGVPGGYYSELVGLPAQTLTTAVVTNITNFIPSELNSDYGSAFDLVSGIWTCPVSSYYDMTFFIELNAGVSGRLATFIKNVTLGNLVIANDFQGAGSAYQTLSGTRYIAQGNQLEFQAVQSSGSNKTLAGTPYIHIGRRL